MPIFFERIFALFAAYYYYMVYFFQNLDVLLNAYSGCIYNYSDDEQQVPPLKIIKYEDKYLDKFNQMPGTQLTTEKMESLKNAFTLEYSPVGNIIMYYDSARESFTYYCDNTVPYRYLEPVSRKYAIDFDCKMLHKTEQTRKPEELSANAKETATEVARKPMKTKDIFAGFKTGAKQQPTQHNIVKETNRYTAMGRLGNFSILKKVDRCVVDKNFKMTFSDFKKLRVNKT